MMLMINLHFQVLMKEYILFIFTSINSIFIFIVYLYYYYFILIFLQFYLFLIFIMINESFVIDSLFFVYIQIKIYICFFKQLVKYFQYFYYILLLSYPKKVNYLKALYLWNFQLYLNLKNFYPNFYFNIVNLIFLNILTTFLMFYFIIMQLYLYFSLL